ncbi:hypothetical protein [Demequina aurantiaca]|uniref:hypothetical protein n=1 Tax=Demequina aurantiaca TaxID=676200 RepID=UPI0007837EEE|nr:hypothetical protein [Demequina aurantiaca]
MPEQFVDIPVISNAALLWLDQSQAVTSASSAVANADSSGFDPAVGAAVTAFLSTWSEATQGIAERAEDTSDALNAAWTAYIDNDYAGQEEFNRLFGYMS